MLHLIIIVITLLLASPAIAAGQWSNKSASNTTAPTKVMDTQAAVYYRVSDTTDSSFLWFPKYTLWEVCMDPDDGADTTSGEVQIRQANGSDAGATNTSTIVQGKTLTGVYPSRCVDILGGTKYQVDVITASSNNSVVAFRRYSR